MTKEYIESEITRAKRFINHLESSMPTLTYGTQVNSREMAEKNLIKWRDVLNSLETQLSIINKSKHNPVIQHLLGLEKPNTVIMDLLSE